MEQFDEKMKLRAVREDCPVPDGFYGRLQETLEELPPQRKRRKLGGAKGALVAAAACVLLVGTAFASSPALRDLLAEALGTFGPVAQEQESEVYRWNGFEFKVLSALADDVTVRVFLEAKDLEKRDRLEFRSESWKEECPVFELGGIKSSVDSMGYVGGTGAVTTYDKATQTGVVQTGRMGVLVEDLSGAKVRIGTLKSWLEDDPWHPAVVIPLDIKVMPSRTILREIETAGLQVKEVRMSALSLTLEWEKTSEYMSDGEMDLVTTKAGVKMKDGTVVDSEYDASSGFGDYRDPDTGVRYSMRIWRFADLVEPDQVAGVYVGEDYFPVK
mgnify:CR=1 FL=1